MRGRAKPCWNRFADSRREILFTEKCTGFDSPPVFCWLVRVSLLGCLRPVHASGESVFRWSARRRAGRNDRIGATGFRPAGRRSRAKPPAAMAGAVAGSGHAGACRAVSPARRRPVSACRDRARHHPERAATRANAAAGIPRGRWRWRARISGTLRPSSLSRPAAAAMPMIFPIRSARRTRCLPQRARSGRPRTSR
jgi:hypothetical protein